MQLIVLHALFSHTTHTALSFYLAPTDTDISTLRPHKKLYTNSESLDDDKNELSHNRLDGGRRRKRRDLTVQLTEIALTKPARIGNFNDSNSSSEVMDPDTTSALPDSSEISNSSNNSKERFEEVMTDYL